MDVQALPRWAAEPLGQVLDALGAVSWCLGCAGGPTVVKLNGRTYEVLKLLGEGGFSLVYLVRDADSGVQFALKKIRCTYGAESVRLALAEVEATRRFRNPNVIRVIDACVMQDAEIDASRMLGNVPAHDEESARGGKVVYIVLPYFRHGNVQDAINAHVVNGTWFGEAQMLRLFLGTCRAVRAMHQYRLPKVGERRGESASEAPAAPTTEVDTAPLLFDTDDAHASETVPSMHAAPYAKEERAPAAEPTAGDLVAYAHRDIKPGNIMIADDGATPVLMDFGSTIKAHVRIDSRREAVAHQDLAAERSSMPYRAPELFDVKTDVVLDEKVDVWSLGCTLYAMAYLHSPFETPSTVEQGGSLALAVTNGAYKFPANDQYTDATREIVRRCLVTDPAARADIEEVIRLAEKALDTVA